MNNPVRLCLTLIFAFTASIAVAGEVGLNYARETWFGMRVDACNALRLCNEFEKNPPANPLMMAYYGASAAAAPECLGNPAKKISYFRKGKALIAEAVNLDPDNFEIRFLRFAVQSKAPSFLAYNQHITEDKQFLTANLPKGRKAVSNAAVFRLMLEFMLASGRLNTAETARVRNAMKQTD